MKLRNVLGLALAILVGSPLAIDAQVNPVYRQDPVTGNATQQQQITVPAGFGITLQPGASLTCQSGATCLASSDVINPTMACDGATDDTAGFVAAIALQATTLKPIVLPSGVCRLTSQVTIDYGASSTLANRGAMIVGQGIRNTVLKFDGGVASPNLLIAPISSPSSFYMQLVNFGVEGNVNGVLWQLGDSTLTNFFNSIYLNVNAVNGNPGASAVALAMANIVGARGMVVANGNTPTQGIAIDFNQVQIASMTVQGGNALKIFNLHNFSFGNFFNSTAEAGGTGWTFASAGVTDNIITGTVANLTFGFDGQAGARNRIMGMALGTLTSGTFNGTTGVFTDLPSGTTGAGSIVYSNSPTLVTPNIGAASGTSLGLSGSVTTGSGAFFQATPSANFYLRAQTSGFGGFIAGDSVTAFLEDGATTIWNYSAQGLSLSRPLRRGAPSTKTTDITLASTDMWVINNKAGSTCTVTFPTASLWTGREVMIQNYQAQTVVSASSNVVPLGGGAAGTAILPATIGKWAVLVSDGTNWIISESN